jgi:hypothetical protein
VVVEELSCIQPRSARGRERRAPRAGGDEGGGEAIEGRLTAPSVLVESNDDQGERLAALEPAPGWYISPLLIGATLSGAAVAVSLGLLLMAAVLVGIGGLGTALGAYGEALWTVRTPRSARAAPTSARCAPRSWASKPG